MERRNPAHVRFAAALAFTICAGCAVSEPIDVDAISKTRGTGLAGSSGAGTAGSGATGTDVSSLGGSTAGATTSGGAGTFGTTGAAGSGKVNVTSGQAGDGTSGGDAGGAGGNNVSGQAGSGNDGGIGGSTGSAGRGGTTGSAGSTGRGGTGGSGSVDAGTGTDGAAAATFTDIYTTILVPYCSGSSCHSPGSQGGVSFASQSAAYTAVSRRVTPGNGASSSFYNTVNSGSMPRGAAKLSATNLAKIKAWIDAGALNN